MMTILAISPALKHTSLLEPPSHKHAYESYSAANLVMVPTRNMLAEAAVGNCRAFHGLFVPLQITAGLRHSMALTDKRKLWAWGDNSEGQLGTAVPTPCLVPTPVHAFPAEATIMYVVAGGEHSLAAVQNLGGRGESQHMWPECRGQGMAALPGPSLAAGLQEQDPHKKACCMTLHCLTA